MSHFYRIIVFIFIIHISLSIELQCGCYCGNKRLNSFYPYEIDDENKITKLFVFFFFVRKSCAECTVKQCKQKYQGGLFSGWCLMKTRHAECTGGYEKFVPSSVA